MFTAGNLCHPYLSLPYLGTRLSDSSIVSHHQCCEAGPFIIDSGVFGIPPAPTVLAAKKMFSPLASKALKNLEIETANKNIAELEFKNISWGLKT